MPELKSRAVVYKFNCVEDCCNASYIGYTMCSLATRAKQHRYKQSAIFEHYNIEHNSKPLVDILDGFSVLYKNNDYRSNQIAESLLIKSHKPYINIKYNEFATKLHIF